MRGMAGNGENEAIMKLTSDLSLNEKVRGRWVPDWSGGEEVERFR